MAAQSVKALIWPRNRSRTKEEQDNDAEAEGLYREALAIQRKALAEDLDVAYTLA